MRTTRIIFQIPGEPSKEGSFPDGSEILLERADVNAPSFAIHELPASKFSVSVRSSTLSRPHARFTIDRGTIAVEDLESRNGTFVAIPQGTRQVVTSKVLLGSDLLVRAEPVPWRVNERFEAEDRESFVAWLDQRLRPIGGNASVDDASRLIRAGVDELTLPIGDGHEVLVVRFAASTMDIEARAWVEEQVRHFNLRTLERQELPWRFEAAGEARRAALALAKKAARSECTVLLFGPAGTGKDVLAKDIHDHSRRARGRFVAINCAAIPQGLFDSEMFGHERGAFTHASARRLGLVESADGGTLFLDEVAELPLEMQAKLLRLLQNKTFRRVGESNERSADVRIIAATNKNVLAAVQAGQLRYDLYSRLSVFPICVPALEAADARSIARVLVAELSKREPSAICAEDAGTIAELAAEQVWAGNVRELSNVLERLAALYDPDRSLRENWRAAMAIGLEAVALESASPPAELVDTAEIDRATEVTECVDQLVFLCAASEMKTVRELADHIFMTPSGVHQRLKKMGFDISDVGGSERVESAKLELWRTIQPQMKWLARVLGGPEAWTRRVASGMKRA